MLKKISKWLDQRNHEKACRDLRNFDLRELKRYCMKSGTGFYPKLMRKLPPFADKINMYIEGKAILDLPQSQSEGSLSFGNPDEHIIIGGILGCRGSNLFEISYSSPDKSKVKIEPKNYGFSASSSMSLSPIKESYLEVSEKIIFWHSYYGGFGAPAKEDIKPIKQLLEISGKRPFYSVLFRPEDVELYWYQMKEV